ncbi:MAG: hypothetical protein AAGA53_12895 [Pseudomonadota bacterium]
MYDPLASQKGARQEVRFLLKLIVVLILGYWILVYPFTDDFDVSQAQCRELGEFWKSDVQSDFRFSDTWDFQKFACPSRESSFLRALHFIAKMKDTMHGRAAGKTYYAWAKQLSPQFDRQILFGLAGKTLFDARRIEISHIVLDQHNWVKTAGVIIHELRHLEQRKNTHVPCRSDPAKTCDARLQKDISTGGAYNYNIMFFHQVRTSEHTSRYEKRLAKKEMQTLIDTRFNVVNPEQYEFFQLEDRR